MVLVVLHVGDIIESKKNKTEVASDFAAATLFLKALDAPWFLTPGNHDINPPFGTTGEAAFLPSDLYYKLYHPINPRLNESLYYSFDVNPYHFIALNSAENVNRDPRWGNILFAKLGNEQLDWLASDLEKNRSAEGIIVFTHMPLWYNVTDWMKVHQLLSKYPVKAVIAGHFHYNQQDQFIDGIQYVVVGATGGTIKQASENAGGMHHVTILQINGNQLDFTLYPIENTITYRNVPQTMSLTPRAAMDRVQMVDQMLSAQEGYKYYDHGLRFSDLKTLPKCESPNDWMFAVPFLGNPLDTEISLEFSEKFPLPSRNDGDHFREGVCLHSSYSREKQTCRLAPEQMISVANLNVVEGNSYTGFNDALFYGIFGNGTELDIELVVRFELEVEPNRTEVFVLKSNPFTLIETCPYSAEK
jgi:3',5'-cyclic AMP phosphodiesterase CpdA